MKSFVLFGLLTLIVPFAGNCFGESQVPAGSILLLQDRKESSFRFEIISNDFSGYGYNILVNGKRVIHQPSIPGLPGKRGFSTKEQAASVAKLVIIKMKKGEQFPSISSEELKKLGVIRT